MPSSGFELDDRAFLASLTEAAALIELRAGEAVERVAEEIARDAKDNAPVLTGRLRDSIHTETSHHEGDLEVDVIADAPYAGFVEFGTSDTPAEPFMRPAIAKAPNTMKATVHGE